jgi:phospholipase/lecithinase/hemolysin
MSIRSTLLVCAILTCLVLSPIAAEATTPQFTAIYVFGDSYCDVGNLSFATGGEFPGPLYYNGRFSNGPIWAEHVASAWGLPMRPSLLNGTDYAWGGAFVTADQPLGGGAVIPSTPHQVQLYLSQHGGKADPNALYILEGGGNDIVDATGGSPQQLGLQIAQGTAGNELLLRRAGARNFLIPNLYNLAITPKGAPNAAFVTAAALAANKALSGFLELEELFPGVHITTLNSFDLFQMIENDATHLGFTDVVDGCLNENNGVICPDPTHSLFWDDIHPTVFGHSFIAVTVEALYSH